MSCGELDSYSKVEAVEVTSVHNLPDISCTLVQGELAIFVLEILTFPISLH